MSPSRSQEQGGSGRRRLSAALALAAGVGLAAAAFATGAPVKWTLRLTPAHAGPVKFSKPVLADLDGDGKLEVILCTEGTATTGGQGQIYVIDNHGTSGSVRGGWPKSLPLGVFSSPAVGDLLGDGGREIVVGSGLNAQLDVPASVVAFHKDGTVLWTFTPPGMSPVSNHTVSSPALGDLNGDGKEDVVFGSFNQYVYALDGPSGNPLPGWPVFVRDSVWSSPALADLDGNGSLEVIIGSESHAEGSPINGVDGGALWAFRSNGTNFPGFPKYLTPIGIDSSPAVGDIDGDGCPEIVVGTTSAMNTGGKVLYAFHHDGTPVTGWPVSLAGHTFTSPILVELNGNGVLDVVENDDTGMLWALKGDGSTIFQMQPKTVTGANAVVYEMAAAQIGSNNPVLLLGGYDVTLVSKTGTQLSENGTHGPGMLSYSPPDQAQGPAVGDLDGAGTELDIVVATGTSFSPPTDDAVVTVWKAGSVGALPWPMFRRDRQHGAWASPPHLCPRVPPPLGFFTITPCRISDSRNAGNGTYGGPSLVGGEVRTLTVHGVCNIPATAKAVSLNITITNANHGGFVTFYPGGDGNPGTSTINFSAGRTLANNLVVPLSFDGLGHLTMQVGMPASSQVDVIVDANGYFQ
ncbi:MAG TPA: VCBS repeat-containing protein [Thermoanaerobaculia bacterium]|nr:VCBS repeat-containing protein [Thermoanaerobaculia bacterium]